MEIFLFFSVVSLQFLIQIINYKKEKEIIIIKIGVKITKQLKKIKMEIIEDKNTK